MSYNTQEYRKHGSGAMTKGRQTAGNNVLVINFAVIKCEA